MDEKWKGVKRMAYYLIEKDYDAEADNEWKRVSDANGKDIIFATQDELRSWVSANRTYPDSVRMLECPDNWLE